MTTKSQFLFTGAANILLLFLRIHAPHIIGKILDLEKFRLLTSLIDEKNVDPSFLYLFGLDLKYFLKKASKDIIIFKSHGFTNKTYIPK